VIATGAPLVNGFNRLPGPTEQTVKTVMLRRPALPQRTKVRC